MPSEQIEKVQTFKMHPNHGQNYIKSLLHSEVVVLKSLKLQPCIKVLPLKHASKGATLHLIVFLHCRYIGHTQNIFGKCLAKSKSANKTGYS